MAQSRTQHELGDRLAVELRLPPQIAWGLSRELLNKWSQLNPQSKLVDTRAYTVRLADPEPPQMKSAIRRVRKPGIANRLWRGVGEVLGDTQITERGWHDEAYIPPPSIEMTRQREIRLEMVGFQTLIGEVVKFGFGYDATTDTLFIKRQHNDR